MGLAAGGERAPDGHPGRRAGGPVATGGALLLLVSDVQALHAELRSAGIDVGEIERPFYMPAGEFRVVDPDGYVLLVGQLSAPPA